MITERAMLAVVHISIWTAIKHDRKVSREVAEQHEAYSGAGRYNKQLLREAERLESLRSLSGQIRQYFYKITLPWSDEGCRLLPAHFFFELTTKMREFEQAFAEQVEEFLAVYPSYIDQVRPELNELFREEDYPSTDKLRNKFGVRLCHIPKEPSRNFRGFCGLPHPPYPRGGRMRSGVRRACRFTRSLRRSRERNRFGNIR
jgi:hypothetical protein